MKIVISGIVREWQSICESDYAAADLSDNSRKSTNVVVKNVYTSDIGASAIIMGDCKGLLMDHVATMDNGFYIDDYAIGVMVPNFEIRTYDCIYQYCEVARQPWSNDGMAWDVDWGNGGTHIYQYNYSHENPNGVYMLCNAQADRRDVRLFSVITSAKMTEPESSVTRSAVEQTICFITTQFTTKKAG